MKLNKRAISLIVLVITIIVLSVLMGVVIVAITDAMMISNAEKSKNNYTKSQLEQLANLAYLECYMGGEDKTDAEIQAYVNDFVRNSGTSNRILEKYIILAGTWGTEVFEVGEVGTVVNIKDYGAVRGWYNRRYSGHKSCYKLYKFR